MNNPDPASVRLFYIKAFNDYVDAIEELTDLYESGKTPDNEALAASIVIMDQRKEKLTTVVSMAQNKYKIDLHPGFIPFNILGGIA
jgi:hypothetical protein